MDKDKIQELAIEILNKLRFNEELESEARDIIISCLKLAKEANQEIQKTGEKTSLERLELLEVALVFNKNLVEKFMVSLQISINFILDEYYLFKREMEIFKDSYTYYFVEKSKIDKTEGLLTLEKVISEKITLSKEDKEALLLGFKQGFSAGDLNSDIKIFSQLVKHMWEYLL